MDKLGVGEAFLDLQNLGSDNGWLNSTRLERNDVEFLHDKDNPIVHEDFKRQQLGCKPFSSAVLVHLSSILLGELDNGGLTRLDDCA